MNFTLWIRDTLEMRKRLLELVSRFGTARGTSTLPWVVGILLLNIVFFWDPLFSDKTYFLRDVSNFHYPLKKLVTDAYSRGEWPLWNPYIQLGQPLLANPNTMSFYPTQLFFHCLPFEKAFNLHMVLHCLLAGLSAFYFALILRISRQGAFFSALIYNFCGVTLSFLNVFNILPVIAFLPGLLIVFYRLLFKPTWLRLIGSAFLLSCFFLLLEPISTITVALFLGTFLVAYWWNERPGFLQIKKNWIGIGVVCLFAVGLSAVQIIPTLELVLHSGRNGGVQFATASYWSLHPVSLIQVVMPGVLGEYLNLTNSTFWAQLLFEKREPYLLSLYLGVVPIFFAVLGLARIRRNWTIGWLSGLLIIFLILAFGKYTPFYHYFFQGFPPLHFGRYPVKFFLGVAFCLSLLAGAGLDVFLHQIQQIPKKHLKFAFEGLILAGFGVLTFFVPNLIEAFGLPPDQDGKYLLSLRSGNLAIPVAVLTYSFRHLGGILILSAVFIALACWKNVRTTLIVAMFSTLLVADYFGSNIAINPLTQMEFYQPSTTALYLNDLFRREGIGRIFRSIKEEELKGKYKILGKSNSIIWRSIFDKLTLFQFLSAKDQIQYSVFDAIDQLETLPSQMVNTELAQIQTPDEKYLFLGGLNVRYLLSMELIQHPQLTLIDAFEVNSDKALLLYRLKTCLPRAFWVNAPESQKGEFSFREFLSPQPSALKNERAGDTPDQSNLKIHPVRIVKYTPCHIELQIKTPAPGLLVLLDSYYPGWKAKAGGHEVKVESVNHVYRGIHVPAGQYEVSFDYSPASFRYGGLVTLSTLFSLIGLLIWRPKISILQ
jgi:hypothetical protein